MSNIDEAVLSPEFLALTKKQERFDFLVDAGIKAADARDWLASNSTTQREVNYKRLVEIFMSTKDKKQACALAESEGVCSYKTGEHLWSAIKFAAEWHRQSQVAESKTK